MEEGFKNWSRKDLRALVTSIERFGRADRVGVPSLPPSLPPSNLCSLPLSFHPIF
jgi:hypothetical protein